MSIFMSLEFYTLVEHASEASESERMAYLKRAVELYRGDFFEEYPYDTFLDTEREKLKVFYLKALYRIENLLLVENELPTRDGVL